MKKLFVYLCPVLFLFFISCSGEKSEDKKQEVSAELKTDLDSLSSNFKHLDSKLGLWNFAFAQGKKVWLETRPMDSIKVAIEKTTGALRAGWEDLYKQALMRPQEIEEWGSAVNEEIEVMRKKLNDFSGWRKKVESGEIPENEAKKGVTEWNDFYIESSGSIDKWMQKWNNFQEADRAVITSFRSIF